jgi:3',5'-cyclic AMP phosphodiesterase CpdA
MKRFILFFSVLLTVVSVFAGDPVFFVQLTDTHFGPEEHFARGRAAVKAINALPVKISFVAVTGDIMHDCIADSNKVNEALAILGGLKVPVHFVPGNHDLLKKAPEATVAVFTNRFGPLISSAEYGGVEFVFVCTEPLAGGAQIKGYDPLNALENLLQSRAADQPSVLFHHTPSIDDFYDNESHKGWRYSKEGLRWIALLHRYPVKAVIAGHFHRDEMHWIGEVPLYIDPPLSSWLGRQAAFRVYEYRDGKIGYRTHYMK